MLTPSRLVPGRSLVAARTVILSALDRRMRSCSEVPFISLLQSFHILPLSLLVSCVIILSKNMIYRKDTPTWLSPPLLSAKQRHRLFLSITAVEKRLPDPELASLLQTKDSTYQPYMLLAFFREWTTNMGKPSVYRGLPNSHIQPRISDGLLDQLVGEAENVVGSGGTVAEAALFLFCKYGVYVESVWYNQVFYRRLVHRLLYRPLEGDEDYIKLSIKDWGEAPWGIDTNAQPALSFVLPSPVKGDRTTRVLYQKSRMYLKSKT